MSELRADPLSPIDAATLWPQLSRLGTEVITVRSTGHLLVSSGLAATGLSRLPALPRTAVLGIRRGLRYRGVCVVRELSGRWGWEVVSTRLARDKDDETLTALLAGASRECAARGARILFLRYPEGSPHAEALRRSGFTPHTLERLHALPADAAKDRPTGFVPATGRDRASLFRLYCASVPEHVRRQEATTAQEWRSVLDSYECDRGFVASSDGDPQLWVGAGEHEGRIIAGPSVQSGRLTEALQLLEALLGRHGTLVVSEHQPTIQRLAVERGYVPLGTRLFCARRLALREPLKQTAKLPAAETVTY